MSGVSERQTLDVTSTARSIGRDFDELVRVLDEALKHLGENDAAARTSLTKARAAAERGRALSARLVGIDAGWSEATG